NMGQGLIQWQGLAFKKSSDITAIKRQSTVLRPYNSAGEFYFHRGIGVTVKKKKIEWTGYASFRKLGANIVADSNTQKKAITSFLNSGYHRTAGENEDKNKISQLSFGSALKFQNRSWCIGVNAVYYQFSLPVHKREEPYNLYSWHGENWYNGSID